MAETDTTARQSGLPHGQQGRIVGVDMARALALFGMMATHLLPDTIDGEHVTWVQQLCGGRAAALFAVLAGVSLALVTARETHLGAARAGIVARAALIGILGLWLGGLDTGIAVILTYYALLFVLGLPFLGLGWRALAGLTAGWAVLAPVVSHLVRQYLPERSGGSPTMFSLQQPVHLLSELFLTGYYPAFPWLAYLLAGLALGRLPLRRVSVAAGLTIAGAVLALTAWAGSWILLHPLGGIERLRATAPDSSPFDILSVGDALVRGLFGTTPTTSWWWLTTSAPHSGTPFDLFQTIGSAMVVLGLCLLLSHVAGRVTAVLFAAGGMTLTLYYLHLVGLHTEVGPPGGTALFWWHVAGAVLFGMFWSALVGRGPLETLARWLSRRTRDLVVRASPRPD